MLKTYAWMKSKYDLSLNVVALFRASHRFSLFFLYAVKLHRKPTFKKKKGRALVESENKVLSIDNVIY